MPRLSQVFPSKHLSAADLNGGEMIATISAVEVQGFDDGSKLVVYFEETDKMLVANKTNARTIGALYGDDTDDWIGHRITLFPTWVDFQGRQVEAIRVRPKPPRSQKPQPAAAPAPARRGPAPPLTQDEADMDPDQWEAHGPR